MRKITVTLKLFDFAELSESAKERAINDDIQSILDTIEYDNMPVSMQMAIDKAEELRTPWFIPALIWEYCRNDILDRLNNQEFRANGEFYQDKGEQNETNL